MTKSLFIQYALKTAEPDYDDLIAKVCKRYGGTFQGGGTAIADPEPTRDLHYDFPDDNNLLLARNKLLKLGFIVRTAPVPLH